ncbi:MAG: NAD(P)H-dependent oxidoreductase subunit E [Kiritimatiellia bacterium]|nr:NAD(P)H-dependent oxidoreductase subunit E [Lentisphaerota bacterium]
MKKSAASAPTDADALPPEILEFIEQCKAAPHPESFLIAVLQRIQEHFTCLRGEHLDAVSQLMQIPSARVTGVATFYHFFSFVPKGRHRISLCLGTACYVKGAGKLLEKLEELLKIKVGETTDDGQFSIETSRCFGACALAPVMVIGERVYGNVQPDDLPGILKEYHDLAPQTAKPA